MSEDTDYLYALEMQRQLNGSDGDSDIEEIVDFKPPPPAKKPLQLTKRSNPHSNLDEDFLNRTQNLVHPQWETLDPTPDIFALFGAFDTKFFQSRLKCVTLEWSKRMYSCAGICYSRRNRLGMEVTIRLSEPLLKLRPRKDLVETMLHEMIHAYCFVLNIREGNGGHGPNFKKIMYGINKVAGTNITVYHTFHDEVDIYKQHWWRCNGSCQNRSPFFGYVKRTSNRAPGPNDQWWAAHLESCGGTFMKIKEPEKPKKDKPSKTKNRDKKLGDTSTGADMRKFFPPQAGGQQTKTAAPTNGGTSNINGFGSLNKGGFQGPVKTNGGGTMLLNPKTTRPSLTSNSSAKPAAGSSSIATAFPPSSYPGLSNDPFNTNLTTSDRNRNRSSSLPTVGNLVNVHGFCDLNSSGNDGGGNAGHAVSGYKTTPKQNMDGRGYSLSGSGPSSLSVDKSTHNDGQVDRNHLRNLWAKRFGAGGSSAGGDDAPAAGEKNNRRNERDKLPEGDSKRRRLSNDAAYVADEVEHVATKLAETGTASSAWVVVDDDIMLQDKPEEIIALSSDSESCDSDDASKPIPRTKPIKLTADQRQNAIKQEILDESMDTVLTNDDIELIDDDYNDDEDLLNTSAAIELADTSLIDDFFGEDTLLKEFKRENDVFPSGSRNLPNPDNDIITCPICQGKMKRSVFAEHLNGCTGIAVKILPRKQTLKKLSTTSKQLKPTRRRGVTKESAKDILRKAGYSEQDLANITSASSADEEEDFLSTSGLSTSSPARAESALQTVDLNSSGECDESTRRYRQRNLFKTTRQCPVCAQEIEEDEMNEHLDECLQK